jgi:hypothetical protein
VFHNPVEKAKYNEELKEHHFEVKEWRAMESSLQGQAKSGSILVLSYDDTSAIGFPRMTNRPIKSMPKDRVQMTPFNLTNHGSRENIYVYDLKGKWMHCSDRLCTTLYTVLRRIKWKSPASCSPVELAQIQCRKLVLLADNATENKNNILFAFLSELVMRGWFDEIQLLYGPVGHTHNGNDAVHFVHNNIAGNFTSLTPAHLFHNFTYAWQGEKRPQPVLQRFTVSFRLF